jgi:hypothetical protein
LPKNIYFIQRKNLGGIPRCQLEGGSRKWASYSETLERCWRHTLQANPPRTGKTLTPPHLQPCRESPLHIKWRNQEGPSLPDAHAQRAWEGELSGTWYSHRQPWARSA